MNKVGAVLACVILLSITACSDDNGKENLDSHENHMEEICSDVYEGYTMNGFPEKQAVYGYQQPPENAEDVVAAFQTPSPSPSPPPSPAPTPAPTPREYRRIVIDTDAVVGDTLSFGGIEWLVLDVVDERMLVISYRVIYRHLFQYAWGVNATWETSDLRHFLNYHFFNQFTNAEKQFILETYLENDDNPWWGTCGGNNTRDRIFLLSIDEIILYFGDSGMLYRGVDESERSVDLVWPDYGLYWHGVHDNYSEARIAYLSDRSPVEWWLRTPGFQSNSQAHIMLNGTLSVFGHPHARFPIGVRPALWLCLSEYGNIDSDDMDRWVVPTPTSIPTPSPVRTPTPTPTPVPTPTPPPATPSASPATCTKG